LKRRQKLFFNTFTIPINNHSIAGFVARNLRPLNIPDVYEMPSVVPYTFDSSFDKRAKYRTQSMLTVPMTNQRKELLGVMQIINALDDKGRVIPFSPSEESLISHFATSAALALARAQMTRNIILRMISMAELRDPKETGPHVNRVGAYAVEIYETWAAARGLSEEEIERKKDSLRMAAMLHDVGKVAISDLILKKADRLSPEEFATMKSHTYLGARLFKNMQSDFEEVAAQVALNHHEKWDGTGYPGHLDPFSTEAWMEHQAKAGTSLPKRGEEIPLPGRIVSVADVYDALSSKRSYKDPWDEGRVIEEMRRLSGKNFDPELIDAFFDCLPTLKAIAKRYPDVNAGE
jgi:response regulator RpfG family c-di-GMP phosphodiesterase